MSRLRDLLDRASCEALVVVAGSSRDPNLAPFIGTARLGESVLIAPRESPPKLAYLSPLDRDEAAGSGLALFDPESLDVARWAREAKSPSEWIGHILSRALHLTELAPGQVAVAGCWNAGVLHEACEHLSREGWRFVAGEPMVAEARKCKTADQLLGIRQAAAGTMAAFRRVAEQLAAAEVRAGELWLDGESLRVGRLRRTIAKVLAEHGLEQPAGNIVAPAEEGAVPHNSGRDERVLAPGESLVVDIFPKGRLFADCTRTFCVGEAPETLLRAHTFVVEALDLARQRARPGIRGWALQEAVCDYLGEAGFPTPISDRGTTRGYVHGLGHGVGFECHEYPSFREEAGDEGLLEAGDVITLEPGLYDEDVGYGVRLEDTFHLSDDGPRSLTPLPFDLDPRAW
ncbi:MAG: Xaa-Pro peptidase family protein [Acidobacteriota bacterium]